MSIKVIRRKCLKYCQYFFVFHRPALVVDHPDRQVTGVDAQVEGDAPHHDQPQFQA